MVIYDYKLSVCLHEQSDHHCSLVLSITHVVPYPEASVEKQINCSFYFAFAHNSYHQFRAQLGYLCWQYSDINLHFSRKGRTLNDASVFPVFLFVMKLMNLKLENIILYSFWEKINLLASGGPVFCCRNMCNFPWLYNTT